MFNHQKVPLCPFLNICQQSKKWRVFFPAPGDPSVWLAPERKKIRVTAWWLPAVLTVYDVNVH